MTNIEIFANKIKEIMKEKGIDRKSLAQNSNLSYTTICEIINYKRKDIRLITIVRISIGLGLSLSELFDSAFNRKKMKRH